VITREFHEVLVASERITNTLRMVERNKVVLLGMAQNCGSEHLPRCLGDLKVKNLEASALLDAPRDDLDCSTSD
jgi:hypothetical protein